MCEFRGMSRAVTCLIGTQVCAPADVGAGIASGIATSLVGFLTALLYRYVTEQRAKRQALKDYAEARDALVNSLNENKIRDSDTRGLNPTEESRAACKAIVVFRTTLEWAAGHRNYFNVSDWVEICLLQDYVNIWLESISGSYATKLYRGALSPSELITFQGGFTRQIEIASEGRT
jgi:hypothetical protein